MNSEFRLGVEQQHTADFGGIIVDHELPNVAARPDRAGEQVSGYIFDIKKYAIHDGRRGNEPDREGCGVTVPGDEQMNTLAETRRGYGFEQLARPIRSYFRLDGHHIQFNVTTAETLREAQQNPWQHRDLTVRVTSYSDYFVDVGREL